MLKCNSQYISELGKIVKENSLRHKIILLETFIGAYQARKDNPEYFAKEREVTGQIIEAETIAVQRQNTLKLLKEISPFELYDKLSVKARKILKDEEEVKEGIYDFSGRFVSSEILRERAGARLETRLKGDEETINSEREEKKKLYLEGNKMIKGLVYEIEKLDQI